MKENNNEDGRSSWVPSRLGWEEIETRLSVLWLALRIVGVAIAAGTAVGGIYVL
jgi:hypothetical protein